MFEKTAILFQFVEDLPDLGKAMDLFARKDDFSVHDHVEDASGACYQCRLPARCFLDGVRQTGGLGFEVSFAAILDLNVHENYSPAESIRFPLSEGYLELCALYNFRFSIYHPLTKALRR